MFSESIVLALVAVSSPILVGVVKELLGAKKLKSELKFAETKSLNEQLEAFRRHHETQMSAWMDKYEALQKRWQEEHDRATALEMKIKYECECTKDDGPPRQLALPAPPT